MSGTMNVRFEVTAVRMAVAMATVALLDDEMPHSSSSSYEPEPEDFTRFVEAMSRDQAREALRTCFWRYGESDCWPDDYPRNAARRALEIVRERGWSQ